jgi:hypothetical protein
MEVALTDHLVAFEYGNGQVWGYIRARSAADIESIVPEVDVFDCPPPWMSDGAIRLLREHAVYVGAGALDSILHGRTPAA